MSNIYTPGPWEYDGEYIGRVGSDTVAKVEISANWEANARLIAASPELLEAAEYFLTATRWLTENVSSVKDARAVLIKAINKARGV